MEDVRIKQLAGILLIAVSLLMAASWTGLMAAFDYPDILRQPVADILTKYADGGIALRLYWTGLAIGSLLIVPAAATLYLVFRKTERVVSLIGLSFGLLTALFHLLGFSRWMFMVDGLAQQYVDPLATAAHRDSIELIFSALHAYLGVTIGETAGFATMGLWAIMAGISWLLASPKWKWWGTLAIASGIGILAGVLEWAGWQAAVEINAWAYQLWIVLLIALGLRFLLRSQE